MLYKYLLPLVLLMAIPGVNQMAVPDASQPSLLHIESVEYPRLAWQARIEGEVKIAAHVALDGKVSSVSASSGHQLLQQAALESLKKWIFLTNHEFDLEIIFQFKLERPESSSQHATRTVVDLPAHRVTVICNRARLDHLIS